MVIVVYLKYMWPPGFQIFQSICATPNFKSWIRPWQAIIWTNADPNDRRIYVAQGWDELISNITLIKVLRDNREWLLLDIFSVVEI